MEIIKHTYKTNGKVSKQSKVNKIILHCAATPEGKNYGVETINKWHLDRGFSMIGYHYVIYCDGTIHKGREDDVVGAHCTGQNTGSIGICYIGGVDSNNKAKDTRTKEQKSSLLHLVDYLLTKYNLTINDVYCHNQYAAKACPSFKIDTFKEEYKEHYK